MNTKAVIFDLDDTLAPEMDYCRSGYRAVADFLSGGILIGSGASEIYDELLELFFADHKNVFNRFLEGRGLPADKEQVFELVNVYREHFPDIAFYDDVLPALKKLKAEGIITGILSDGYAVTQRQKIRALGAEDHFDIIILTDELGKEYWKPSPKGFEIIEEKYSLDPSEIIYVGDNPGKDFYLKKTAGIRTARIIREEGVYKDAPYYKDVMEDLRIGSLGEVIGDGSF